MKTLDGCIALVTGAADGLGQALALEASALGARVLIVDIADGAATAQQIRNNGGLATTFSLDISNHQAVTELARRIEDKFGSINVLVNNAAAGGGAGPIEHADLDQVRRVFDVNIFGTFCMTKAFAPLLRKAAGNGRPAYLLNVGSEHSLGVPPHVPAVSAYTASKYAIRGLTDTARRDLSGSGVHVALLAPGWIRTRKVAERAAASPVWAESISPHAQEPSKVAHDAFAGLLAHDELIVTNSSTRSFALDHARSTMIAVQRLPVTEGVDQAGPLGAPNICPFGH